MLRRTLLALACFIAPLVAQAPPSGDASLTGAATFSINGQPSPIRRARVVARADDGSMYTTDTNTLGQFRFDRLAAGTYHVVVDKPGLVPISRAQPIEIRKAQAARTAIAMQRGAAIEGLLVTEDGQPAMGFAVSAVHLGFGPYGKKVLAIQQTMTDDLGRFRLHTLAPGEYYVEAAPDSLRPPVGSPTRSKPTLTYYPGTSRLDEAQSITLSAEQQMAGLQITLRSAVLATVRGRVASSTGGNPVRVAARLQRVGAPAGEVRCLMLPENGAFQCPNVPPGDFWLLGTSRATADANVEFTATRLTVDSQDVSNVVLTTGPGVSISGRLEVEGGAPVPPGVQVTALETEYDSPSPTPGGNPSATPPVNVGPDGAFSFPSMAGSRLFRVSRLPKGWALKGVWLDDTDISDAPTMFGSSERPHALRMVIAPRTGSVGGAVLNAARQPVAGAQVVVFTDDFRRWTARSRFIQTGEVSASGQYLVDGLLPGKYWVAIVDPLDDGAWEDPDVLARLKIRAKPIVVNATERVTLDWSAQ